jgi:hypothetical protein
MATSQRVSELHAILRDDFAQPAPGDWSSLSLRIDPSFIAKTEITSESMKSVVIPALTPVLCGDMEEKLLCPVRALRFYMKATKPRRGKHTKMFLPLISGKTDEISKQSISRWIRDTVRFAYSSANKVPPEKIRGHDTRRLSSSWTVYNQVSIESIMKACTWTHKNTFVSHYLRNMSRYSGDLYRLGPIVTSQHVVAPSPAFTVGSSNGRDRSSRDPPLTTSPSHEHNRSSRDKRKDDKHHKGHGGHTKPSTSSKKTHNSTIH